MFNPLHENIIDYEIKCITDINFINELNEINNNLIYKW